MKYIYLTLLFFIALGSQAQSNSCYEQWKKVFENRGAGPVQDGVHDKVIITKRVNGTAECFNGRVVVKQGVIVEVALYYEDESYEVLTIDWKDMNAWQIHNGMSTTKISKADEMYNVMFSDVVLPKKKKFKSAPTPNFELN